MNDRLKYLFLYLRELDKTESEKLRSKKNSDNRIDFVLHTVEFDIQSLISHKRKLYEWSYEYDKHISGLSYSNL